MNNQEVPSKIGCEAPCSLSELTKTQFSQFFIRDTAVPMKEHHRINEETMLTTFLLNFCYYEDNLNVPSIDFVPTKHLLIELHLLSQENRKYSHTSNSFNSKLAHKPYIK